MLRLSELGGAGPCRGAITLILAEIEAKPVLLSDLLLLLGLVNPPPLPFSDIPTAFCTT